jgi:SNF2 family DNA or RNA helicase
MVTDSANPLEVLTALRQIAGRETMLIVRDMAKNFMEESDEKLIIFFHHLEVMNFLMHELEKYGVDALYGDVSPQKKLEKAQIFQNEPLPRIMLINTAANESIDLFRSADIIFAEREWSPAPEEQAEARLDRNGQARPVTSSYVTLTGTVVERLAGIVEGKRHEFGKVMRSDDIETSIMAELWDATRRAVAARKARAGA